MQRELKNGDLVLIHERYLQAGPDGKGVTGIVVGTAKSHKEVTLSSHDVKAVLVVAGRMSNTSKRVTESMLWYNRNTGSHNELYIF